MRILFISSRADIGGGPAQMHALIKDVKRTNDVFCALPPDELFSQKVSNILPDRSVINIPHRKFSIGALIRLKRFCTENSIELVHSHGKGAGLYSRLLGALLKIRVIHTLHGIHDGQYSRFAKKLYHLYERAALLFTDKIICVSESERRIFVSLVGESKKVVVVTNGTPTIVFQPTPISVQRVVCVNRLSFQKNVGEVLDVAKHLPDWRFDIYGDGECAQELYAQATSSKLSNVHFRGSTLKVLEEISGASVFLSTSRWEGLPLSPLEAMSIGIPLVLSNVAGNSDVIQEGVNGYLYPLGDIDSCISAIVRASALPRSAVANIHASLFSEDSMCKYTQNLYEECLA
jgi:glycosyltransferase involved in cell wall biosynthesis